MLTMAWEVSVRKDYRWWRSWAKERQPDPDAVEIEQDPEDLLRQRAVAQRRAAAAEHVAKEANAARLKALLDAARDEADRKTIEIAEQRFDEAKGEWEAVRDAFLEEQDRQVREQHETTAAAAAEQSAAVGGWVTQITDGSPQRIVTLGVLAVLVLGVAAGAAGFLLFNDTVGPSEPGPRVDLQQTPPQAAEMIGTGKAETESYRPAGASTEPAERVSPDTASQQSADLPPSPSDAAAPIEASVEKATTVQSAGPSAAIPTPPRAAAKSKSAAARLAGKPKAKTAASRKRGVRSKLASRPPGTKPTAKPAVKPRAEAAEVATAAEEPKSNLSLPFLPDLPSPARGEADDPAAPFNNAPGEEAE